MKLKVWNQYLNQWENSFELRIVDGVLTAYIEDDVNECEAEATIILGTNLTDKDGKDIYEGDILKITRVNWYCPGHPKNNTDLIDQVEVYWDEEKNGMFTRTFDFERLKRNPNQRQYCSSSTLGNGWNDERADKNIWEVIGNIYDNPELLKHDAVYTDQDCEGGENDNK